MFFVLGISAIPQAKVIRALFHLGQSILSKCTLKQYEKLVGLLLHCAFLVYMDPKLLTTLHDPITFAKRAHKGNNYCIDAKVFHDHATVVWPAWVDALSSRSCSFMSAAVKADHSLVVRGYTVDMYGDAYREPPHSLHNNTPFWMAGIGGYMHGYHYFFPVPSDEAAVIDITKLEHLAQPGNFLTLGHLLPRSSEVSVGLHADGFAAAINMAKGRVSN